MATITPSVVNSPKETMTSKGGYLRLTITSITDSDATTNKRYIGCKLTIEGNRWVGLYKWESTLGGQTVSSETRTVENWYPGHVLGTKNLTFDNDSAGNLSLTAYIKHIFYKGSGSWNTSYAKSITETLVCSQLPRYANFTSHSATSTLNTITVSYAADAAYGAQQYSLDGGNWTDCSSGSYTLSGFTPGSSHTIKTRIQRSDSGLWTESDQINISLKSLPTSNNVSNVNFDGSYTRVDVSISSIDYLSQWYIKIYDENTLVRDGSNAPNYASSTSDYWTIQNSDNLNMLNRHGSTNSWTLTIKFYVVSNNITYELSSKTCACTIPSGSYLPTYNSNNLSYTVQDNESNNITGSNQKVIKGISDVRIFTTQASPQGGAGMSSYTATSGTKSGTSTSLSNTYIDLYDIDSNSFSVQATDTRGRSTVASKYYSTYIDYFTPYINSGGINISRVDGVTANLNISISGTYMNWSGLSTSNTITQVGVQYKLRNSQSWTTLSGFNLSISASNGNFTASGITTGDIFDIANEYDIKIILKDKLRNVEANGIIYTANVLLWKDLTNHRLGIGKKPSETLDVNGNIIINGNTANPLIIDSPGESSIRFTSEGNGKFVAGYKPAGFDGYGIYSWEESKNVFTINKYGEATINGDLISSMFKSYNPGMVNTQTLEQGLQIKEVDYTLDNGVPNNGIVLEYSKYSGWGGQLYIGDNDSQGVWFNGWSNGNRGAWKRLAFENDAFNDASGNDWQEMLRNKIDFCINTDIVRSWNGMAFINGGWAGVQYGFGVYSKIGDYRQLVWFNYSGTYYVAKNMSANTYSYNREGKGITPEMHPSNDLNDFKTDGKYSYDRGANYYDNCPTSDGIHILNVTSNGGTDWVIQEDYVLRYNAGSVEKYIRMKSPPGWSAWQRII